MRTNLKQTITKVVTSFTLPATLLVALCATPIEAAPRKPVKAQANVGLRADGRIVAVNGVRVSSEAALRNRIKMSGGNAKITVARNGRLQTFSAPAPQANQRAASRTSGGFGIINPALMVMTSQGVMHRDAAARLGLPGTPISGTPEWPHEHPRSR
ncbi:MAG: hypothetical protein WD872_16025 [Pirellulaceae bacterium]